MTRLSENTPLVHATAEVMASTLGRFTGVEARSSVSETVLGDYSYVMQDCRIWAALIGKSVNIAAAVRINATSHPTPATLHHFTYRAADYFEGNERLAWWDWPHERLFAALADFRAMEAEAFLDRYEGVYMSGVSPLGSNLLPLAGEGGSPPSSAGADREAGDPA